MAGLARRRLRRAVVALSLLARAPGSGGQRRRRRKKAKKRAKRAEGQAQCVICWEEGAMARMYGCASCGNAVCSSCADRYLETCGDGEEPPACPLCRSSTWCLSLLEHRADGGRDVSAAFAVGLMYMEMVVEGGATDKRRKAIRYLKLAADADNAVAAHNLGTLFMSADLRKAKAYLSRAGLPVSTLNLAFVHKALGEPRQALSALKKAASGLCAPAFYFLGLEYHDGSRHAARNPKLAVKLLEIAAALGDVRALKFLAHRASKPCTAAAFLLFVRDVLGDDNLDPEDYALIRTHARTCRATACPAHDRTCLCCLIPHAFAFVNDRRRARRSAHDDLDLILMPPTAP